MRTLLTGIVIALAAQGRWPRQTRPSRRPASRKRACSAALWAVSCPLGRRPADAGIGRAEQQPFRRRPQDCADPGALPIPPRLDAGKALSAWPGVGGRDAGACLGPGTGRGALVALLAGAATASRSSPARRRNRLPRLPGLARGHRDRRSFRLPGSSRPPAARGRSVAKTGPA